MIKSINSFKLIKSIFSFYDLGLLFLAAIFTFLLFKHLIKYKETQEHIHETLDFYQHKKNTSTMGGYIFIFIGLLFFYLSQYTSVNNQWYYVNIFNIVYVFICIKLMINNLILKYERLLRIIGMSSILLCFYYNFNPNSMFFINNVMITTLLLSYMFGSLDDILKKRHKEGLSENDSHLSQLIIGSILVISKYKLSSGTIMIPSVCQTILTHIFKLNINIINLKVFYIPILLFLYSAFVNGVNFTDGIDGGLGISTLIILLTLLTIIWNHIGTLVMTDSYYVYANTILMIIFQIIPLLVFLFFNLRGKLFMGNVGSASIGNFLFTVMLFLNLEMYIPLLGVLFFTEVATVFIQRYSIRLFKKKLFKFTPIHHHFTLLGWSDVKIVGAMSLLTLKGCLTALGICIY